MAHLHLQLFAHRFNEIAEDYLRRFNWIYAGVVSEVDNLLRAINATCSKQHFASPRSLVFDDVAFCREILHFFDPVQCCQKTLWNTDTLIMHILRHGGRDELDEDTKRLAILFNLYVQIGASILVRYDNNYEMMEQFTAQLLRKAADYLSCIRNKPVREDASAGDTFAQGTFAKWKYVFDYTCTTCCDAGIKKCRFDDAIAWFKIHQTTLVVNQIRHLGTKVHAANMRNVLPDHIVPTITQPRQEPLEINNNTQWSKAAMYLLEVRESELDKLCFKGAAIQLNTPVETIRRYLKGKLDPLLTDIIVEPFGSRVTGVGNDQSDLDLRIKWKSNMKATKAYLKAVEWAKTDTSEVEVIREIPAGPMVLTIHVLPPLDITLDLTFASPYIVANSELIQYFFRLQPMARKLFFLLKEWKQQTNLSRSFHHHVLIMMILFHMQQEKYIPPIVSLLVGPVLLDNNTYNTAFAESITSFQRPTNLLTLLRSFFAYWSQFNWARNGACLSDGRVRPKESFRIASARKSVPPMMATDYFDQSRNIAASIHTGDHQKFVQACKEAVEVLQMKKSI
ncbi:uncharacterized protein LOC135710133 [Ochlerotatus camptorhynchus]|uniref:uncharacterized protein LOC135710133 n=1 Tax=Ochlerotatus camptorhynchus TaxID=644619 RepID=UPI0031E45C3D